jgi:hypothetical protein
MVLTRWLERFSNIAFEEYIIGVQPANGYTPTFLTFIEHLVSLYCVLSGKYEYVTATDTNVVCHAHFGVIGDLPLSSLAS